jgi:hypothetical protein
LLQVTGSGRLLEPHRVTGERALVKVLNSLTSEGDEDSSGVMAGAAWYVGAAFCPGIGQVQGMRHFVEHTSYTGIAQAIMQDPNRAQEMINVDDVATRAAMLWLATRTELSEVLRRWHQWAQCRFKPGQPSSPVSPVSSQRKAKRKSVAASRRKNRR